MGGFETPTQHSAQVGRGACRDYYLPVLPVSCENVACKPGVGSKCETRSNAKTSTELLLRSLGVQKHCRLLNPWQGLGWRGYFLNKVPTRRTGTVLQCVPQGPAQSSNMNGNSKGVDKEGPVDEILARSKSALRVIT